MGDCLGSSGAASSPASLYDRGSPHILAIPFPLPGHIRPIVQLCKVLMSLQAGCTVTLVNTERNSASLAKILGDDDNSLITLGRMRVVTVPDGLQESGIKAWDYVRALLHAFASSLPAVLEAQLPELLPPSAGRVSCVLSDVYLAWAQDLANKLGVPRIALWTSLAAEFQVYLHAAPLIAAGTLPFKVPAGRSSSEDDIDDIVPSWTAGRRPIYHRVNEGAERVQIPGLLELDRLDFPSFLQIEDSSDIMFTFYVDQVQRASEATMVLVNTIEELEEAVLSSMRMQQSIRVHAMGPLFMLQEEIIRVAADDHEKEDHNDNDTDTDTEANYYDNEEIIRVAADDHEKEDHNDTDTDTEANYYDSEANYRNCMQWLDKQAPQSVMYVAFGTGIRLPPSQLKELIMGLEASQEAFLLARANKLDGLEPEEALGLMSGGRGLVVDWAPQSLVLRHPAIGGFLSHCGWNSTLESLSAGVPMLACPFATDQILTSKLLVQHWQVALRLEKSAHSVFVAEHVANLTTELITGEEGQRLRSRARKWKAVAKRSVQSGGSSRLALDRLIEKLENYNHISSSEALMENSKVASEL